jgi:hypothetical protein
MSGESKGVFGRRRKKPPCPLYHLSHGQRGLDGLLSVGHLPFSKWQANSQVTVPQQSPNA